MKSAVASVLALALAACGAADTGPDDRGYGEGLGTPENPVPADDGRPYRVATRIDFTVEAVLPPQIELAVETLRAFSDNPARTLITIADRAGVPAVKQLYDALPGFLTDRLEGWINGELEKIEIAGKSLPEYAGEIAALAEIALTQFGLDSELALAPDRAVHTLTALDFTPAGLDLRLPITGLAADVLTQKPEIWVAEGGALWIGDQHFGLAFGEYAWLGINMLSTKLFGSNVRGALGKAIRCPALAHTIASKCALGVCVGHESELEAICEGGLDALVGIVRDQLAAYNVDVFRFITGEARLVDDDQDGIADRIVNGTWDAEMNLGLGLRHTPATFTGTR